jgi:sterol desaturase/sphingolipid hydroxylase (fatty acid hydroxylase superfamily)
MEAIKLLQANAPGIVVDAARVLIWLALLLVVFVPLERFFALRKQKTFRKHLAVDLGYYFINSLLPKLVLIVLLSKVASVFIHYGPSAFYAAVAELPVALRFGAALVVGEISAYWGHRLMHENAYLWRFHAIHHSAEELDWVVNTRAHPIDILLTRFCGLLPLYALGLAQPTGLNDSVATGYALFGTIWSFLIHANLNWRFGKLETFISTPAFHHWHHTNDGREFADKNYSALFPWVDRMFGTLYLPKHWPSKYGIGSPIMSPSLLGQLLQPFRPPRQ